jgi:hypothetical protein
MQVDGRSTAASPWISLALPHKVMRIGVGKMSFMLPLYSWPASRHRKGGLQRALQRQPTNASLSRSTPRPLRSGRLWPPASELGHRWAWLGEGSPCHSRGCSGSLEIPLLGRSMGGRERLPPVTEVVPVGAGRIARAVDHERSSSWGTTTDREPQHVRHCLARICPLALPFCVIGQPFAKPRIRPPSSYYGFPVGWQFRAYSPAPQSRPTRAQIYVLLRAIPPVAPFSSSSHSWRAWPQFCRSDRE